MIYIVLSGIIIFITSFRGLSFALWQFKRRNIFGGVMVTLVSVLPAVLILLKIWA